MLVHGNQPETLRDLLVTWMRRYPLAPLEQEICLAQSNGIAQWLKLALAANPGADGNEGGLGIAAALEVSLPSRFLWRVYRSVLGPGAVPETSPFDESRLIWRLMRLLPQLLEQAEYAPIRRFLTEDADLRKRFQLAERLADLLDQYQVYRADWLDAWAAGEAVLIDARGTRVPLAPEQHWQASLWRALLDDVESGHGHLGRGSHAGRAAVHAAFLRRAADWPPGQRPAGLPRRLLVFGISSMPRQSLEVLAVMARWTQILMCVHNPCEHYWADIVADQDLLRAQHRRQQRRDGMPEDLAPERMHLHAHPLLAAWGKQGRDFIGLLDEHDDAQARAQYAGHFHAIEQRIDLFAHREPDAVNTLLGQLQDDIRDLRPLTETRTHWPALDPRHDRSIRFHTAHGPQREVEVLHDQLLAAFNADPSLTPRDCIVMVPDIDAYAPYIQAVFGLLDRSDPRFIPYSVADQGQRATDPLVQALATLLALPQSRLAVSDLLDLLEVPALRRRFGIDADDLPRLHRWVRGANIRWGLHAEQRASLDLPPQPEAQTQHTWRFGLRRMLLGYAVGAGTGEWQGIEPFDEIGGLDAALLGPLVRLIERLDATWHRLREPATVADWCVRLRTLMADFLLPEDSDGDAYTLLRLESALQEWQEVCDEAALTQRLPLSIVGEYWLSRLDAGGLSQRFFAGAVTFATLMPMRAIPFRQVCLLGMNDSDYPRQRKPMDFDLMGRDYRPGDRSRREDDRYLFLEALLSARDRLHCSWVGRSITDNSPRPPSVLVGQLRDHLAAGWRLAGYTGPADKASEAFLDALTQEHRLQPFSPDYFPPHPAQSAWFTYAREWRPGGGPTPAGGGDAPLAPLVRDEPLTIRELADFLKTPVKTFFRQRLGVYFEDDEGPGEDQEPFALDGLERWQLQNELIQVQAAALARDETIEPARAERMDRIRRRGDLAAGAFGEALAAELVAPMDDLFERYQKALARWPQAIEDEAPIRFQAADPQLPPLADWLGGLRVNAAGERGRVVLESSDLVKDKQYRGEVIIRHWVMHLAGHLTGAPLTTQVISKVGDVELKPLTIEQAQALLTDLLAAWHAGMRQPLPLAAKTAFAWLKAGNESAARKVYEGADQQRGEVETDAYLARAYPGFDALCADGAFTHWAETLLRPLFEALHAKP
ncbi:exodeoxyribonuclease V subunit gamma [uncultured Thiodictyon sp.]|uniref:exodeoxyribonuclease V subunit gamma n=1 Tax=uncultured Thiodictyon sp. TaxID=1846217 RepID=UPI0025DCCFF2|nr:exodeoxyribonuclease V subunit gamma [uncultured Thiodictyon sp.]